MLSMRVVLATGIYPPEIGGPATYVAALARALRAKGVVVQIIAYGEPHAHDASEGVTRVSRAGGPLLRYVRYARTLRTIAAESDVIEAFSSVSVGIPLWLSHLRRPKKILRLGGDFLWERATDRGEERGLRQWYEAGQRGTGFMNGLLRTFDVLVFSTAFQEELYRRVYRHLPLLTVIENVFPHGTPVLHARHDTLRLLFFGRFVAFKNLTALIDALPLLPRTTLTLAGEGPMEHALHSHVQRRGLSDRVTFLPPQHGTEKDALLQEHDVLVLPSTTEISPNTALEARAAGLPVLLTQETGLSRELLEGVTLHALRTPDDIAAAVKSVVDAYDVHAERSAQALPKRDWNLLADEHIALFSSVL